MQMRITAKMTIQVPYLPDEIIERDAEALLAEYAHSRSVTLEPPIPVEKHLKLRIEFDDLHKVLGVPQVGPEPEIFGAIWVDKREICLHECLDPEEHPEIEGRYRFTLGHEGGGHWRLHRAYLLTDPAQASMFHGLSRPAVICRSSQAKVRVEWQADFYASCLLMPRKMVTEAWRREFGTNNPIVYELMKHMPAAHRPRGSGLRSIGQVLSNVLEPHTYLFDQVAKRLAPILASLPRPCASGWRSSACSTARFRVRGRWPSAPDCHFLRIS
jgi:hypothetical protein